MLRKQRKLQPWRRFGYVILIIIKFGELLLWFSPRIINGLRSYIKHSKGCFIRYPNTLKLVKEKVKISPPAHILHYAYSSWVEKQWQKQYIAIEKTHLSYNSMGLCGNFTFFGKISAQPQTTLCIQFLGRENNDKNNTSPLGKQICLTIAWGCAEILPFEILLSSRTRTRSKN